MALYKFPPFEFDSHSGRLLKYGTRLKLQQKPQIVLSALLERGGEVITRQELYRQLWPDGVHVDFDQGLSVAIKKLRDALADPSDVPRYVATVPGVGYRFIGDLVSEASRKELIQSESIPTVAKGGEGEGTVFPTARSYRASVIAAGCSAIILIAFLAFFASSLFSRNGIGTRSVIAPPPDWRLLTRGDTTASMVLSPDGTQAVFGASNPRTGSMLLLRKLNALSSEPIPGTAGAAMPFWSPDGQRVAFFAEDKLKVVDLRSGVVRVVCAVKESPRGGTWGPDNTILFAESTRGPILRVAAGGGAATPVTSLSDSRYTTHRWPEFLPDGEHFLFLAANHEKSAARSAVYLGSLDSTPPRLLVESDSNALFVSGNLVFVSGGKLLAQPWQRGRDTVSSVARILADNVEYDENLWHATFSATPQLLVYRERPEAPEQQEIVFLDKNGNVIRSGSHPGMFRGISVSPDAQNIAATCDDPNGNLCVIHPDRSVTRIAEKPINDLPAWSPDGLTLAYGTHRGANDFALVSKDARGRGAEEVLIRSNAGIGVDAWTPDRHGLLIQVSGSSGKVGLAILGLADRKIHQLLKGDFNIREARFSPDGHWLAYQCDKSGRYEVYITSYPNPSKTYQVSMTGGHAPRWSRIGRELYYLDGSDAVARSSMAVIADSLSVGPPQLLFRPAIVPPPYDSDSFDVTGDQPAFVVNRNAVENNSGYVLVTSWSSVR